MKRNFFVTNTGKASGSSRGFTLIEVMVSVSIFAIITTVGIGALLSINNSYKRSRSQRTAVDSLTFILDSMSRDIRTGSQYNCNPGGVNPDCYTTSGSTEFQFRDQDGRIVTYRFLNQSIERTIDTGAIESLTTPDTITITDFTFRMKSKSAPSNDTVQPFVVISIVGEAQYANITTPIMLQTSITQRRIDFPTN